MVEVLKSAYSSYDSDTEDNSVDRLEELQSINVEAESPTSGNEVTPLGLAIEKNDNKEMVLLLLKAGAYISDEEKKQLLEQIVDDFDVDVGFTRDLLTCFIQKEEYNSFKIFIENLTESLDEEQISKLISELISKLNAQMLLKVTNLLLEYNMKPALEIAAEDIIKKLILIYKDIYLQYKLERKCLHRLPAEICEYILRMVHGEEIKCLLNIAVQLKQILEEAYGQPIDNGCITKLSELITKLRN